MQERDLDGVLQGMDHERMGRGGRGIKFDVSV